MDVLILIPLFNDWSPAAQLLRQLDQAFLSVDVNLKIIVIDDASTLPPGGDWSAQTFQKIKTLDVLRLKTNIGHQRALAVGLSYIAEKVNGDLVLIMDGDGEDQPKDAVRLVEKVRETRGEKIVFAQRTRRSENLVFRGGYFLFRIIHYILTGRGIDIGNFSAVPSVRLPSLTHNPMLWNHYAASIMRSRQPFITVATERGQRLGGKSHLNFVALVIHGLQALACYSDIIGVRIILASFFISGIAMLVVVAVLAMSLSMNIAFLGGVWLFAAIIGLLVVQVITLTSNFTVQIISARSLQPFLPARDYAWFVAGLESIYPKNISK